MGPVRVFEQEKLHEINVWADEYQTYLRSCQVSLADAKKTIIGLKSLYWQAGEQMACLINAIDEDPKDGFHFRMLVGTAYAILDSLEAAAELARIGEKIVSNGKISYVIKSECQNIKLKNTYGKRSEKSIETYDYDYFRFLRSFISAHPLETNWEKTIRGFLPGTYAFCQYVDRVDESFLVFNVPDGADYYVQILEDGSHWDADFYINSKEVWAYVKDRFNQLVDTIHKTMKERIEKMKLEFKSSPLNPLSDEPSLVELDELAKSDWQRGGLEHTSLMEYKIILKSCQEFDSFTTEEKKILTGWIWNLVKESYIHIQELSCRDRIFNNPFFKLFDSIGCDHNQFNNLSELMYYSYSFGPDCDNYVEEGLDNYQKLSSEGLLSSEQRKVLFEGAKTQITSSSSKTDRINLISAYYRETELPREEISRLYFVIVLPEFVEKYELLEDLIYMESFELFLHLTVCAIKEQSA